MNDTENVTANPETEREIADHVADLRNRITASDEPGERIEALRIAWDIVRLSRRLGFPDSR